MARSGEGHVAMKRPRRCVQSKLSFSVSPQAVGSQRAPSSPDAASEDAGSDYEVEKKNGSRKGSNKMKSRGGGAEEFADNVKEAKELSGQRKKSARNLKTKQSGGETPRKNKTPIKFGHVESSSARRVLSCKSDSAKDCLDESQPFYDLWSEAKKAAEENMRLSAGKQTHPFFSICKATKILSETKHAEKSENSSWHSLEGDYCISLPPVHVFDTVKDDVAVPNWEKWNFLETSHQEIDGYCGTEFSSFFDVSTESLILGSSCGKETRLDTLLVDEKIDGTYMATSSSKFSSEPLSKEQLSSQIEEGSAADNEQDHNKMYKGRLASYCRRFICLPDCSLWTEKYRPEISLEICGNAESVELFSDWLKSWQERVLQKNDDENIRNNSTIVDSEDSSYVDESDMDELDDGDSLKNVLLITGPAGCGKSAAIYACAREQGFKVIEVNASSLRNGAYMRQTFGEGVDSLGLTHWLAEDQTHQQGKDIQELQLCIPTVTENGLETHSSKLASRLYDIENATEKNSQFHIAKKTLFLFEEVDVVFDEDHGFVSMILKLAETTRRPIILTSNTKRPVLPHLLDRLVLDFKTPSYDELLYHASMVCSFEKVSISDSLLEHIITSCAGDIRRVLMLLQFWCQGFRDLTEQAIQCTKNSVPFDIDALHLAIPNVIPWDFRCELSEKVEEEISNAVFATEETSVMNFFVQHDVSSTEVINPLQKVISTSVFKSKKSRKLRKHSIIAPTESSDHMDHLQDFFYDSDSPSTCFQKPFKRKRVVLYSESDDGHSSDEIKPKDISTNQAVLSSGELKIEDKSAQSNLYSPRAIATAPTSQSKEIHGSSQLDQINESRSLMDTLFDISEVASTSHICDSTRTHDVSCLSASSSIFGTEANPNLIFISQEVSYNSEFTTLFDSNITPLIQPGVSVNITDEDNTEISKRLENHSGTADVHVDFLQGNHEIRCFQNEEEHGTSQCQFVDGPVCSQEGFSVPKTWSRLRGCETNSKLLSPNSKDVALVASLTSGLVDLISEIEIMYSRCSPIICDSLEPTSTPCVEPDSFCCYDDQLEMGCTIARHGLCFYTMKLASVGSCLGCNNASDVAQEMLNYSTSSTSLGKLIFQENIIGQNNLCSKDPNVMKTQSSMSMGRGSLDDLYSAILPIVPARLSMVLKGVAFHEYASFVGHISRFECSRLAESSVEKQKRRSRSRMHYLSSGAHQLSSEQAQLLAQRCYFTSISSIGNPIPANEADAKIDP